MINERMQDLAGLDEAEVSKSVFKGINSKVFKTVAKLNKDLEKQIASIRKEVRAKLVGKRVSIGWLENVLIIEAGVFLQYNREEFFVKEIWVTVEDENGKEHEYELDDFIQF